LRRGERAEAEEAGDQYCGRDASGFLRALSEAAY
jgi:hypothetical protein